MVNQASATYPPAEFDGLKEIERLFVSAYVADPKRNGTKAAIAAGYACGENGASAAVAAHRLLRKDKIIKAVQALERWAASEDCLLPRLVAALKAIAFTDLRDVMRWDGRGHVSLIPSDKLEPAAAAAIASIQDIQEESQRRLPGLEDDGEAAVNIIRRHIKLHDKMAAMKLLAQITGVGGAERVEVAVSGEGIKAAWARAVSGEAGHVSD
jgi:phage terminase small subunit